MPLNLTASSNVVSIGNRLRVEATGGTPPYAFSLPSGGVGGSIDVDGIYTAPLDNTLNSQIIRVTDDVGAKVDIIIFVLNHLQLVASIIKNQMGLEDEQVYIYNQKITPIKDNKMYIAVGVSSVKVFASNSSNDDGKETLSTSNQAQVKIDVMSKTLEAFNRKEEVASSLRSAISQQVQNANMFKIGRIPTSMTDLSGIDGSAIPYRFNIVFNMLYFTQVIKDIEYYDGSNIILSPVEIINDEVKLDNT